MKGNRWRMRIGLPNSGWEAPGYLEIDSREVRDNGRIHPLKPLQISGEWISVFWR